MDVVMIQFSGFLKPQQQLVANLAQKVHKDDAIPLCWQRSMVGTGKSPPWLLFTSRPTEFSMNWLGLSEKDGTPVTKNFSTEGAPWHAWAHIFFLCVCLTITTTKSIDKSLRSCVILFPLPPTVWLSLTLSNHLRSSSINITPEHWQEHWDVFHYREAFSEISVSKHEEKRRT